jgi:hypothetical protein
MPTEQVGRIVGHWPPAFGHTEIEDRLIQRGRYIDRDNPLEWFRRQLRGFYSHAARALAFIAAGIVGGLAHGALRWVNLFALQPEAMRSAQYRVSSEATAVKSL